MKGGRALIKKILVEKWKLNLFNALCKGRPLESGVPWFSGTASRYRPRSSEELKN